MNREKKSLALFLLALLNVPHNSYSASINATLPVSATVLYTGCSIQTSTINFGNMFGSGIGSDGNVIVNCKFNTAYAISLNGGLNPLGNTRRMKTLSGNTFIDYVFFQDSARLVPWGNGVNYGFTRFGIGSGTPQTFYIYGKVIADITTASPGNYSDQVNVTISY